MSSADNGDQNARQRTRNVRWSSASDDPESPSTGASGNSGGGTDGDESWPDLTALPGSTGAAGSGGATSSSTTGNQQTHRRATRHTAAPPRELDPLPIPTLHPHASPDEAVRIGLWGSSRSGKTTFLSALPLAAQDGHSGRNWRISGIGDESTQFLTRNVDILARQRKFPNATLDVEETLRWAVSGEDTDSGRRGMRFRRDEHVEFVLELQDVPGEVFKTGNHQTVETQRVIGNLANANGLLYLFDPLADLTDDGTSGDQYENFAFFNDTLHLLLSRVRDAGRLEGGRLPHHLGVCLTKFDDREFFEPAVRAQWVNQQQHGSRMPYVPADQTRGLFDWVCDEFVGGTAPLVRDAIDTYFHPGRVGFFATSAIGFRLNARRTFDYRDYSNVQFTGEDPRIRTNPSPVNVIEPLMWLERHIRKNRARPGKKK